MHWQRGEVNNQNSDAIVRILQLAVQRRRKRRQEGRTTQSLTFQGERLSSAEIRGDRQSIRPNNVLTSEGDTNAILSLDNDCITNADLHVRTAHGGRTPS